MKLQVFMYCLVVLYWAEFIYEIYRRPKRGESASKDEKKHISMKGHDTISDLTKRVLHLEIQVAEWEQSSAREPLARHTIIEGPARHTAIHEANPDLTEKRSAQHIAVSHYGSHPVDGSNRRRSRRIRDMRKDQ